MFARHSKDRTIGCDLDFLDDGAQLIEFTLFSTVCDIGLSYTKYIQDYKYIIFPILS